MSDQLENAEALESQEVIETNNETPTNDDVGASTEQAQDSKPEISDYAQKLIAEKAFKEREAKRQAEDAKRELEELRRASAPKAPSAPSAPDRWSYDSDEDFNEALEEYVNKKAEVTAYETQKRMQEDQQAEALRQQHMQQQQALSEKAQAYSSRAKDLGVSAEELQQAGSMIQAFGIRDDVVAAILEDADGPLITKYLASNPQSIDALNGSTWLNGQEVFNRIKQNASGLKPKTSAAPPPPEVLTGGAPQQQRGPNGATFE